MVERYGYIMFLLTLSGGGLDENHDPIPETETWTPFECDVQTSSGRFVVAANGDKIAVQYKLFIPLPTDLVFKKGGTVKNPDGETFKVLQSFDYRLNLEVWL